MPLYEYTCGDCDTQFEKLVKSMSGDEKIECPKCGSKKTARALSVFAVGAQGPTQSPSSPPSCGRCGGAPGSCGMG